MKTIYCISGLGADERAFSKLKIEGYKLVVIPWLIPERNESISNYASRMRVAIDADEPILMGLSFGGMLCIEIAKQINVSKVILISSIKTSAELPAWMKTVAWLKLNRIIPLRYSKLTEPIQNIMLGVSSAEEKNIAINYRKTADKKYVRWAVEQALNWKNEWTHPEVYHIHGDHDRMFPIKRIRANYTLKKAGHFMIMNRAEEVSDCIKAILGLKV